jgi:hypothetical protein
MRPKPISAHELLLEALARWVARHSQPDEPVLQVLSGTSSLSPADIVREIKARSALGIELLELFDSADEVIASLDAEVHEKKQGKGGTMSA